MGGGCSAAPPPTGGVRLRAVTASHCLNDALIRWHGVHHELDIYQRLSTALSPRALSREKGRTGAERVAQAPAYRDADGIFVRRELHARPHTQTRAR